MKVGLIGVSGSGKSTLANLLFEQLYGKYNVCMLNETVRDVFKEFTHKYGFKDLFEIRNSDKHFEFQKAILDEQVLRERKFEMHYDLVICDRTIYDNLVYSTLWMDLNQLVYFLDYWEMKKRCHNGYDLLFQVMPVDGNLPDDGFRSAEKELQNIQKHIYERWFPEVIKLPPVEISRRMQIILDKIQENRCSELASARTLGQH